jgi:curved DNA-binding protein CbpA
MDAAIGIGSMRTLQQAKSHPPPSGEHIPSDRGSTPSHTRTSSASSAFCATSSLPPSALRKGKYDTSQIITQHIGPSIDLSIIHSTYGENTSLYNILRIKSSADNNVIRRAYLKQGRKTLLDHGIARKNGNGGCKFVTPEAAPKKLEDVPADARKKFQAISIAYEILSTPELRRAYDSKQLAVKQLVDLKRVTSGSGNSVRWNPFVEEKIIEDSHPDEHSHRKKASEDGWLHHHLQRLDQEAEMFLNGDFLDEIDESIASMSESLQESIGSLIRKGMASTNKGASNQDYTKSNGAVQKSPQAANTSSCSKKNRALQTTRGKAQQKPCLRNGRSLAVQTQFSEEVADEANGPMQTKSPMSFESPCSVMSVGEFVSEVMDEAASMLAESFSGLLDRSREKKLESDKPHVHVVTPTSLEEIRALERKRLDEQLREGFGEPFYCPSPHKS